MKSLELKLFSLFEKAPVCKLELFSSFRWKSFSRSSLKNYDDVKSKSAAVCNAGWCVPKAEILVGDGRTAKSWWILEMRAKAMKLSAHYVRGGLPFRGPIYLHLFKTVEVIRGRDEEEHAGFLL